MQKHKEFEISDDPKRFKISQDNYPESYRCVLLRSLYYYFKKLYLANPNTARDEFDKIVSELKLIKSDHEYLKSHRVAINDLFQIFLYIDPDKNGNCNYGIIYVDKSENGDHQKGVYPLLFYPKPNQTDTARLYAFDKSIEEVCSKINDLIGKYFIPKIESNIEFKDFRDEICAELDVISK